MTHGPSAAAPATDAADAQAAPPTGEREPAAGSPSGRPLFQAPPDHRPAPPPPPARPAISSPFHPAPEPDPAEPAEGGDS